MSEPVFLSRLTGDAEHDSPLIRRALELCGLWERLTSAKQILLKPNLTYPFPKDGVTTTPNVLDSTLRALLPCGKPIVVIESDGGSSTWSATDALRAHCDPTLPHYRGQVQLLNLSTSQTKVTDVHVGKTIIQIDLPEILLDCRNVLVTMPVPKRHAMTGVSLGLKNQWGCLPDTKRLKYHYAFNHIIVELNKRWDPICLVDGTFFLDETGPMEGTAVRKNLIVVGSVAAASYACCELMDVPFYSIAHHRTALSAGYFKESFECHYIAERPEPHSFRSRLRLTIMDRIARISFRSRLLTHLLYVSRWAKPIHEAVYLVKGRPKDIVPQW
jgi:uncharacterized protein (DUF362 family)